MKLEGKSILSSKKAWELFASGKEWITKQWKGRGKKVLRMKILPKTIGRNAGFIMEVFVSGEEKSVRYYAKIQSLSIDTVMMHYLLKYTKCGPDEFHIVLLTSQESDCFWYQSSKHGVITREAENCKMAIDWTETEGQRIASEEKMFRTESFLMTLFVAFGRFGNLPHNLGNWGLTKWEDRIENKDNAKSSSLMIIDFSPGGTDTFTSCRKQFRLGWITSTLQMCRLLNKVDADGFLLDYLTDFTEINTVVKRARNIDWLYSKETLLSMLQRVCNATERWIVNTTRSTGYIKCDIPSNRTSEDSGEYQLTAFRNVRRPRLRSLNSENRTALYELLSQYDDWIWEWNEQLRSLLRWFPFPAMFPAGESAPASSLRAAAEPGIETEASITINTSEKNSNAISKAGVIASSEHFNPSIYKGVPESAASSLPPKRKYLPERKCQKKPRY